MKEVEHDLEALIRRFKIHEKDARAKPVRLTQEERVAILAALRVAIEAERLG